MAMGMSYKEFWYGDVRLAEYYRKAYEIKQRKQNENAWLQGLYVYHAIGAFAEILPAFPKKNAKIEAYLKEPYPITRIEQEERQARMLRERQEQAKQRMLAFAERWNQKHSDAEIKERSD